jgi:GT2 family glycosyltransferase
MTELSVIIATRGRPRYLRRVLRALAQQTVAGRLEILVVDDSRDGTAAPVVSATAPGTVARSVLLRSGGGGPARARNTGIRRARGGIVAFLDDDSLPEPNWAEEVLTAFEEGSSRCGVVKGKVVLDPEADGPLSRILTDHVYRSETSWASNNIAYRRNALRRVGGFDERFRLPAYEDVDLGENVVLAGWERTYRPEAVAAHPHENSSPVFRAKCRITGAGLRQYCALRAGTKPKRVVKHLYWEFRHLPGANPFADITPESVAAVRSW